MRTIFTGVVAGGAGACRAHCHRADGHARQRQQPRVEGGQHHQSRQRAGAPAFKPHAEAASTGSLGQESSDAQHFKRHSTGSRGCGCKLPPPCPDLLATQVRKRLLIASIVEPPGLEHTSPACLAHMSVSVIHPVATVESSGGGLQCLHVQYLLLNELTSAASRRLTSGRLSAGPPRTALRQYQRALKTEPRPMSSSIHLMQLCAASLVSGLASVVDTGQLMRSGVRAQGQAQRTDICFCLLAQEQLHRQPAAAAIKEWCPRSRCVPLCRWGDCRPMRAGIQLCYSPGLENLHTVLCSYVHQTSSLASRRAVHDHTTMILLVLTDWDISTPGSLMQRAQTMNDARHYQQHAQQCITVYMV